MMKQLLTTLLLSIMPLLMSAQTNYEREVSYYTRKGDLSRAQTYSGYAKTEMDKCRTQQRYAAQATDKMNTQLRYAQQAEEKAAYYLRLARR